MSTITAFHIHRVGTQSKFRGALERNRACVALACSGTSAAQTGSYTSDVTARNSRWQRPGHIDLARGTHCVIALLPLLPPASLPGRQPGQSQRQS